MRASDSNSSKSNFKSYKSFTRGCAVSQQRQRVNSIFISACFNLHFAFRSFPSDKDTPRTGLCKKIKNCYRKVFTVDKLWFNKTSKTRAFSHSYEAEVKYDSKKKIGKPRY